MKVGIFGTGTVGETIGSKLVTLGHEVKLGGRSETNEKGEAWIAKAPADARSKASYGTFAQVAAFAQIVFNCTKGEGSVDAVTSAKKELTGKTLIDVSNPLDFSKGFPPSLFVSGTDSLAEQIQRAVPEAKVVKALNTVTCALMVDAGRVAGGESDLFVCGDDEGAKKEVTAFLREQFGWRNVIDLGGLSNARGTEAYLLLWVRLYGAMKTADFNVKVVR